MNIRPNAPALAALTAPPLGLLTPFRLVDVGASGGIPPYWSAFDPLEAVGFDPLVSNMEKMARTDTRPGVRYEAAYVGCHDFDRVFPPEARQIRVDPYPRVSSTRAQELMQLDFVATHFNEGDALVWTDRHLTLDEYFAGTSDLDFLKVDTDGGDLQVLIGADGLLQRGAFLGVMIEAQFQGWPHDYANVFANLDRVLRSRGFALFDLDLNRYTRAALPGRFAIDLTAQTLTGQILWGDALFFRDLAHPQYETLWGYGVTRDRLLKLAALYDLFGLPDCAAELLLARPELTTEAERARLLDLLAQSAGIETSYAEHIARFERDPASFFPRVWARAPEPSSQAPSAPIPGRPPLQRRVRARAGRLLRRLLPT